jgi:hypothetical protein
MNYMPYGSNTLFKKSGMRKAGSKRKFCHALKKRKKVLSYAAACNNKNKHEMGIFLRKRKWKPNILDVECYLPDHLPKRNKYHLHVAEDLEITNQKISISHFGFKSICYCFFL